LKALFSLPRALALDKKLLSYLPAVLNIVEVVQLLVELHYGLELVF
jgi:hypothetical protein